MKTLTRKQPAKRTGVSAVLAALMFISAGAQAGLTVKGVKGTDFNKQVAGVSAELKTPADGARAVKRTHINGTSQVSEIAEISGTLIGLQLVRLEGNTISGRDAHFPGGNFVLLRTDSTPKEVKITLPGRVAVKIDFSRGTGLMGSAVRAYYLYKTGEGEYALAPFDIVTGEKIESSALRKNTFTVRTF